MIVLVPLISPAAVVIRPRHGALFAIGSPGEIGVTLDYLGVIGDSLVVVAQRLVGERPIEPGGEILRVGLQDLRGISDHLRVIVLRRLIRQVSLSKQQECNWQTEPAHESTLQVSHLLVFIEKLLQAATAKRLSRIVRPLWRFTQLL